MDRRWAWIAATLLLGPAQTAEAKVGKLSVTPGRAAVRAVVEVRGPAATLKGKVTVGGRKATIVSRSGGRARVQVPAALKPGRRPVVAKRGKRKARGKLTVLAPFGGTVGVTKDAARAKGGSIGPAGGAITATGADGTTYVLRVPAGALAQGTDITVTPVRRFTGLPFTGGRVAGADLAPDGLRFATPATLEITGKRPWPATMVAFNAGDDFEVRAPQRDGTVLRVAVPHFSAGGAAAINPADLALLAGRVLGLADPLSIEDTREAAELLAAVDAAIGGAVGCAADPVCSALKAKTRAGFDAEAGRRCGASEVRLDIADVTGLTSLEAEAQAAGVGAAGATDCALAVFGRLMDAAVAGAEVDPFGGCKPSTTQLPDLDGDGAVCHLEQALGLAAFGRDLDAGTAARGTQAFDAAVNRLTETLPEQCETNADAQAQLTKIQSILRAFGDGRTVTAQEAIDKCTVKLTISPKAVTLDAGAEHQFTVAITGILLDDSGDHTWSAAGGTIDQGGSYTAPDEPGTYTVTVKSDINAARSDSATVTVEGCGGRARRAGQCVLRNGPILYEDLVEGGAGSEVLSVRPDGTQRTVLTGGIAGSQGVPRVSPDGRSMFLSSSDDQGFISFVSSVTGSNARKVPTCVCLEWSPDSTRLVGRLLDQVGPFVVPTDGGQATSLNAPDGLHPSWRPDGERIVYVRDLGQTTDVFTVAPDGTGEQRLTDDTRIEANPRYSPDGTRLAWYSFPPAGVNDDVELVVGDADGTDPVTIDDAVLPESQTLTVTLEWSPDGTRLLYRKFVGSDDKLVTINADGTDRRDLTPVDDDDAVLVGAREGSYSPEGDQVVYSRVTQDHSGDSAVNTYDIAVVPALGGAAPVVVAANLPAPRPPDWAPAFVPAR